MPPALTMTIQCQADALVALIEELNALLDSASPEAAQAFAEAVEGAGGLGKLVAFDPEPRTADTGEVVVVGKPTQRLLDLAAAFRAANGCEH